MTILAILTDIEGTTSSISFVKDVLFPYAREHLPAFVAAHGDDEEVRRWLDATAQEAGIDAADRDAVVATLRQWIDEDRKATPLKALQGMIWRDGYASGAYRAHLYPEVADRLRAWKDRGLPLYVYSSGSVAAQRLFFRYSEAGDLSVLFDGHFDTEVGGKREAASYTRISAAIGVAARDILFLSDIVEELDAARSAGLQTVWLCRPPLKCPEESAHPCVAGFDAIAF
jgi:enolase-phosphatase E1